VGLLAAQRFAEVDAVPVGDRAHEDHDVGEFLVHRADYRRTSHRDALVLADGFEQLADLLAQEQVTDARRDRYMWVT
jgi:hypothetical protein